ncbi:hypothetical protein [Roseobacter sp. S98]
MIIAFVTVDLQAGTDHAISRPGRALKMAQEQQMTSAVRFPSGRNLTET